MAILPNYLTELQGAKERHLQLVERIVNDPLTEWCDICDGKGYMCLGGDESDPCLFCESKGILFYEIPADAICPAPMTEVA